VNVTRRVSALATSTTALATLLVLATRSLAATPANDPPKTADKASATEFTLAGDVPADWLRRLKAMPNLRKLTVRRPDSTLFQASGLKELEQLSSFRAADFFPLESPLADAVAVNLAKLPALLSATFDRTGLTDRGLAWLVDSSITELVLKEEEFLTDQAFEHVAKMKSLRTLVIDATPIDVAGLEHLRRCPQLRSLALRRHPAGGADELVAAIARIDKLEDLEIDSTDYTRLGPLSRIETLRQLTLRRCGATEASQSLKRLKQLDKLLLDNCDIGNETFADVKAILAGVGIEVVDATRQVPTDLLARASLPVNEATKLARQLHDELDIAKRHPAFWIRWRSDSYDVPSMKAGRVRTVYRLKKALSEDHVRRPVAQETIMAWAPGQFYLSWELSQNGVVTSQQIKYGDAKVAWAREGRPGKPPRHFIRNGISEFVDSLFFIPRQLRISHQSYWWGVGTHYRIATSSVSPREAIYHELHAEQFAGETCRVLASAGRNERLWVSKETGRLRGSLSFIHGGYFSFHQQNIVDQVVGHPVTSVEEYRTLFGDGANALPKDKQHLLRQALSEDQFDDATPFDLDTFDDYRQIAPGRWFPFRVQSAGWQPNEQHQRRYDCSTSESIVTEVALDRDDLQKYWADALPKKGEKIQDQRYGVPVEYDYGDDLTVDEIQERVNDRLFEFARSAILIDERTRPIEKMIGKPAPALPMDRWIGERPDVKGKRYLIYCWATWCGPCKNDVPLLNSVSESRIVIGVHPSGTEMDEIRKAVTDEKMAYPTVVAAPRSKDLFGYPVTVFPYCIEVDEEGNVAGYGLLVDVLGLGREGASTAKVSPDARGEVLGTDSDGGLAAISLGEADGVRKGQLFHAMRDGLQVAHLRIVFVSKNCSVGKVVDDKAKASVNKGDGVQRPID
jgi:thiol-disulfide isomerase/thioredoxin